MTTAAQRRLLAGAAALALLPAGAAAQRPRAPRQPWWADTTRWPPGTFRRTVTARPERVLLLGDTLRLPGPALPAGLPDSLARDVRWSADEPALLDVDATGRAIALAPGRAVVTAWTRVGPTLTPVRIVAALRGRVWTADDAPAPPLRVIATRADGSADTTRADAAGAWAFAPDGAAPVRLDVEPLAAGWWAARTTLPVPLRAGHHDVVLIPRSWTVRGGPYAGAAARVDPAGACTPAPDGSPFWHFGTGAAGRLALDAPAPRRAEAPSAVPVGWDDAPIPLAVLAGDSAGLWRAARALEADLGGPRFAPAPADAARAADWRGIAVTVAPRLGASGLTTVSYGADGTLGGALVEMRSAALVGDPAVATHELLHALGFGHASRWASAVADPGHASLARATVADVAHAQLAAAVRRLALRTGARVGLADARP